MYIFIFEDGTIRKNKEYDNTDINSVNEEIIDITNPLKPLYCLGKNSWVEVSNV